MYLVQLYFLLYKFIPTSHSIKRKPLTEFIAQDKEHTLWILLGAGHNILKKIFESFNLNNIPERFFIREGKDIHNTFDSRLEFI